MRTIVVMVLHGLGCGIQFAGSTFVMLVFLGPHASGEQGNRNCENCCFHSSPCE
jgi:hypothetical protein